MGRCYILGAGFSKAVANLPVMKEMVSTFTHIRERERKLGHNNRVLWGLPDTSKDLPEAKQKLLKGYVERIAEHAKNLDKYGDGGNRSKTEEEFGQLKKRLDYMRKLYPDSMFHAEGDHRK